MTHLIHQRSPISSSLLLLSLPTTSLSTTQGTETNTKRLPQQRHSNKMSHQSRQRPNTPLSSSSSSKACVLQSATTLTFIVMSIIIMSLCAAIQQVDAASARVNMHQVSRQTNQYFLNEFCDLESKTIRNAKKVKQAADTHSLFLTSKNTLSSVKILPQKQQMPSSISFGFGSSQQPQAPIYKQLNCSIIVVAPKSHGLLVTVNSIGLPANLTKLGIILNHDSSHAQQVHLEGETTSANYLLTQPQSSKIAINLQSFKPIDWSHVSFDILFTVYKKANSTGCPNKRWFDCGDNICVPSSLVCDNNRNCPNGNDEMIFYRCYSPLFWSIAASTALALILITLMVSVILVVRRRRGLSKQHSLSNNVLASETDLMNESKLDLTHESVNRSGSYLASNLYLGGFENPVWTNGTLTKQQTTSGQQNRLMQQQQQLQQAQVSSPLAPQVGSGMVDSIGVDSNNATNYNVTNVER